MSQETENSFFPPDLNKVLLSWTSPSHPFKKRSKMFYQTLGALVFLLITIAFFLSEYLLIVAILALFFLVLALTVLPPVEVQHKITPLGFENAGRFFSWGELDSFWFEKKWEEKILVIHTRLPFPTQIRAVLREEAGKGKVREVMGRYLLYREKPWKTITDKLVDWFVQKFPLEG